MQLQDCIFKHFLVVLKAGPQGILWHFQDHIVELGNILLQRCTSRRTDNWKQLRSAKISNILRGSTEFWTHFRFDIIHGCRTLLLDSRGSGFRLCLCLGRPWLSFGSSCASKVHQMFRNMAVGTCIIECCVGAKKYISIYYIYICISRSFLRVWYLPRAF